MKAAARGRPRHTIPAVCKAMELLGLLAEGHGETTTKALALRLGVPRTTCYRMLRSVIVRDWVGPLPGGGHALSVGLLPLLQALREKAGAMKLAEFLPAVPNRLWELSCHMGVRYASVKASPELTGQKPPWDRDSLRAIQARFGEAGFTLYGLEGDQFDMRRIKLGLDGRDEDLERYCQTLRNMGELGIPLLCDNFMAGIGWHRTHGDVTTRGGVLTSRFDLADVPASLTDAGEVSEERSWQNYEYFIRRVMLVAEQAGVRMGMHPDDPPLPVLRGLARILYKPENFEHAMALVPSPNNGVTFCQANFKLMGCDPTDMPGMLKRYHEWCFSGPVRVAHVPTMAGESNEQPGYESLGRLFAIGYIKGVMQALKIPIE